MKTQKIVKRLKNIGIHLFGVLAAVSVFLAVVLYNLSQWVIDTWGLLSMDEIVFHLKVPLEGTNEDMVSEAVNLCLPVAVIVVFVVIVLLICLRKRVRLQVLMNAVVVSISVGIIVYSGNYMWKELNIDEYVSNQKNQSTFIQDNYVDPRTVDIVFPEQKRNLIYIYAESLETAYASEDVGGAMKFNIIPELTQLAEQNVNFSNSGNVGGGYAATGATWTMGGMFAQTSGLPLSIPIDGNGMQEQETFLPEVDSLGDILGEQGYQQVLMIGSDATFGGRRNYFTQHGDYEMCDYYDAIDKGLIPEDYKVFWGYEDQKLFEFSKEKLIELSLSGEPFNFTMLTVDTHFPDGYVCPLCQETFPAQYENVIACASRQIVEFVRWIQTQPFYENTTIVISGDHLTMQPEESSFFDDIDASYDRRVYNAFINSPVLPFNEKNREFNTMDMFPTTLAGMGAAIEGDRLGLGTNLFSNVETLSEVYGKNEVNKELERKSTFFDNFVKDIN